ncbi:MAG: hypothetical protein QGI13_13760, partial [Rhodospirillales bacterium]|nr:hypothetical protein [Rhodospirillales bacterium]
YLGQPHSFFTCNQARLNAAWKDDRDDHLLRLLVQQIFPLFVEEGGPELESGGLSRKMLPSLFRAITAIVGARTPHDYDRQCSMTVKRLRGQAGDDFEWDDFFNDPEARRILIRILAELAHGFGDAAQGREWFFDGADGKASGVPEWRFDKLAERHIADDIVAEQNHQVGAQPVYPVHNLVHLGQVYVGGTHVQVGNYRDAQGVHGLRPEARGKGGGADNQAFRFDPKAPDAQA